MAALPDGGLRYGGRTSGLIFDVSSDGVQGTNPLAYLKVSPDAGQGLMGLVVEEDGRTYVSYTDPQHRLIVSQVVPGDERIVWQGPVMTQSMVGGGLAMTPQGRLIVGVGTPTDAATNAPLAEYKGTLITLDPSRDSDQVPNVVSRNWQNPRAVSYINKRVLWVADNSKDANEDVLARGGDSGVLSPVTKLDADDNPSAITPYGDQEIAVCNEGSGALQRFLIEDGTTAVPGRVLATDCHSSVVQLGDGRLAYTTVNGIRTTIL